MIRIYTKGLKEKTTGTGHFLDIYSPLLLACELGASRDVIELILNYDPNGIFCLQ